jgi:hypothetical protein
MSNHEDEYDKPVVENAEAPMPGLRREATHEAGLGGGTGDLGGGGGIGADSPDREEDAQDS